MPKLAELIQIVMLTAITCPRLRNFDDVTDHVTDFRLLSAYCRGVKQTAVHSTGRCAQRFGSFLEPVQFRRLGLTTPSASWLRCRP